jgi:hypothetical protein
VAQSVHLLGDRCWVEWGGVDELERPGANDEGDVVATECVATLDEAVQAHVGERAAEIGEHLDRPWCGR